MIEQQAFGGSTGESGAHARVDFPPEVRRAFQVYRADGRHLVTMPFAHWAQATAEQIGGFMKEITL